LYKKEEGRGEALPEKGQTLESVPVNRKAVNDAFVLNKKSL